MATRHSRQMPMPQSGPRASPVTDARQGCPAIITATATVVPAGTATWWPFTVKVRESGAASILRQYVVNNIQCGNIASRIWGLIIAGVLVQWTEVFDKSCDVHLMFTCVNVYEPHSCFILL